MSMDCAHHVSALLHLHPELSSTLKQFKKTELSNIETERLKAKLCELFIEKRYTYSIVRIFRPIAQLIITTVARKPSSFDQETKDKKIIALSKVLPLYPQSFQTILEFLKQGPPLMDRVLSMTQSNSLSKDEIAKLKELIQTAFRLLCFAPDEFSTLWNWSPFFVLTRHSDQEIRWFASRCVSLLVKLGEDQHNKWMTEMSQLSLEESIQLEFEELQDQYFEKQLAYVDTPLDVNHNEYNSEHNISYHDSASNMVQVCGVWLHKKEQHSSHRSTIGSEIKLVYTPTTTENMGSLSHAVAQGHSVLLEGVTGSGKTALVEDLAHLTGNTDLVKVNLDDSFDSKDLLGTYVCTDVPGEFKWQPGALTKAVTEGKWILIEDIDFAPFDILSVLIPLVESNTLFIPSRDEILPASPGFRLFATQSLVETISGLPRRQRVVPISNLWTKVVVDTLPGDEIQTILSTKFPKLKRFIPKFTETYETLRSYGRGDGKAEELLNDDEDEEVQEMAEKVDNKAVVQLQHYGRYFSFRDLLKFCARVSEIYDYYLSGEILVDRVLRQIFGEAVDCFCGMISKRQVYERVVKTIARVWKVPLSHAETYLNKYKPDFRDEKKVVSIGRISLSKIDSRKSTIKRSSNKKSFAYTKASLKLMERLGVCVRMNEPVLLTGETGTGKTTIVQHLADLLGIKMVAHNLNQQTDSADFIGGYKPVELSVLGAKVKNHFEKLFIKTFSKKSNEKFLEQIESKLKKQQWSSLIKMFQAGLQKAKGKLEKTSEEGEGPKKKRKNEKTQSLIKHWDRFDETLHKFEKQQHVASNSFAFSFIEGSLVKALKEGNWILLDEINLASTETLERLNSLLESKHGSLFVTEKGDTEPVKRHPNFRLFACMNPPTDVGKKDLPPALKNRFTEFYVEELLDPEDLATVVQRYIGGLTHKVPTQAIVDFYLEAKDRAISSLSDGAGRKPHYSLRTLSRALDYTRKVIKIYGFARALYEGFSMSFLTQLSRSSFPIMEKLIRSKILAGFDISNLGEVPKCPGEGYRQFEHFWLEVGDRAEYDNPNYILTKSVSEHLKNLARVIIAKDYPVLLQGPTSAGKTSMIEYLANCTGHRFVRINNHEHTDLQEYLGTYVSDTQGGLVFKEGILVEAVRNGYWIVLDELNLAPSEILEALNRLLDDNRELFIPETQELVKPHPHFRLFATQNPPGIYGGRKTLSRAFRNRFLELHVDDIPEDELIIILKRRCQIPESYAKKLVAVMNELQRYRQGSQVFAGKHGFITPRDLFRWADRRASSWQELAAHGYMLLAERLRRADEKQLVKHTLEKNMLKGKELDLEWVYNCENDQDFQQLISKLEETNYMNIVWTKTMKRLFKLIGACLKNKEPVLLVGETGCGKTTICQLYSLLRDMHLHIVNCHQHTEASDFLGGLRPVRGKEQLSHKFRKLVSKYFNSVELDSSQFEQALNLSDDDELLKEFKKVQQETNSSLHQKLEAAEEAEQSAKREKKKKKKKKQKKTSTSLSTAVETKQLLRKRISELEEIEKGVHSCYHELKSLFVWYDGPLVEAMKNGDMFLVDEISLAEDSILERLNSVLEPDRLLVLAEKGSEQIEEITAHHKFRILATMNPGGDFGKRELSPALRNRFTEIFVPSLSVSDDLQVIIETKLPQSLSEFAQYMVKFVEFHRNELYSKKPMSIRDIIAWIEFINVTVELGMDPYEAFMHGAEVVVLDSLGIGTGSSMDFSRQMRQQCFNLLIDMFPQEIRSHLKSLFSTDRPTRTIKETDQSFEISPFKISKGGDRKKLSMHYTLDAPTTSQNVFKLLRAMQLRKPLLLEGSPGVGKTSLITALAARCGHNVVRINLSEQTDMMDLLGTDLPAEGGEGGQFQWCDGIFLRALKNGDWVLLDELNLASQSVLEGLNSVLDHRSEIFIPELNQTFTCPSTFRIFACQNPLQQGGGRKGLPKSFLNRFTQVYVDEFETHDLLFIASSLHPEIEQSIIKKMIQFNHAMHRKIMVEYKFGRKGSPWEFNLRDVLRWCELMLSSQSQNYGWHPEEYVDCIYAQRMRTQEDREHVFETFEEIFGVRPQVKTHPYYHIGSDWLQIGKTVMQRNNRSHQTRRSKDLLLLHSFLNPMENILKCAQMGYMSIITGPASSGKTSLVRLMAYLTGNPLNEFSMNSSTDTVELLGGFEQVDPDQKRRILIRHVKQNIDAIAAEAGTHRQYQKSVNSLLNDWNTFCSLKNFNSQIFDKILNQMIEITNDSECQAALLHNNATLVEHHQSIQQLIEEGVRGRFEWSDGMIIRAMERGEWLLVDNVNFCNPTVLDRLNSLLEPGGVLVVNERGMVNGELKVVKPHPNFRIFLVMNPKYGEISRAMRNRGIEIGIFDISIPSQDALKLLCATGLSSLEVCYRLMQFHSNYLESIQIYADEDRATIKDLIRCAELCHTKVMQGVKIKDAFAKAVDTIYIRNKCFQQQQRFIARSILDEIIKLNTTNILPENITQTLDTYHILNAFRISRPELREVVRHSAFLGGLVNMSAAQNTTKNLSIQPSDIESLSIAKFQLSDSILQVMMGSSPKESDISLPVKDVENILLLLGEVFAYTTSPRTVNLRREWLNRLRNDIPDSSHLSQTVEIIQFIFEGHSNSKLWEKVRNITQTVAEQAGANNTVLEYSPLDIRLNTPLFQSFVNSLEPQILNQLESSLDLVWQHLRRLKLRYEEKQYISIGITASAPQLLKHAYWCYSKNKHHRGKEIVRDIFPVFIATDKLFDSILDCQSVTPEILRHLESINTKRDKLWKYLANSKQLDQRFHIWWRWFTKAIYSAKSTLGDMSKFNNLYHTVQKISQEIDQYFGQQTGTKNRLWKYGGHPIVQTNTHKKTLKSIVKIDQESSDQHLLSGQSELREALAKGASTIEWACGEGRKDIGTEHYQQEISQIPQILNQVQKLGSKSTKPTEEEVLDQIFTEARQKEDPEGQTKNYLYKYSPRALHGLLDHKSMIKELGVISDITDIAAKLFRSQVSDFKFDDMNTIYDLSSNLSSLLSFVIHKTSRSPLEMVPYQIVSWKLSSFSDSSWLEDSKLHQFLSRMLQDMWHRWSLTTWNNTFNKLSLEEDKETDNRIERLDGPVRLMQDIKTLRIIRLLTDWKNLPFRARETKSVQLKHIVEYLSSNVDSIDDVSALDWKHIKAVIFLTFLSFWKAFPKEQFSKAVSTMDSLLSSELNNDTIQQYVKTFVSCFDHCDDERLLGVGQQFSEIIASISKRPTAKLDPNEENLLRGKLWVQLGTIRIRLITPARAVDPMLKFSIDLEETENDTEEISRNVDIIKKLEQFISGDSSNLMISKLYSKLTSLRNWAEKVKSQTFSRNAQEDAFPKLFKDLKTFLVTAIDNQIDSLIDSLVNVTSEDVDEMALFKQEQFWQDNAEKLCDRIQNKYIGYEDIVLPFVVCVQQIQYGLRILLHASLSIVANKKKRSTDLTIKEMNSLLRFFLSFPTEQSDENMLAQLNILSKILDRRHHHQKNSAVVGHEFLLSVFRALLYQVKIKIVQRREIDKESLRCLDIIFASYVKLSKAIEHEEERKRQEESQQVKYKTQQSHIMTEEEVEEAEMSAMFPSYLEEYSDITQNMDLESNDGEQESNNNNTEEDSDTEDANTGGISVNPEELLRVQKKLKASGDIHQLTEAHHEVFNLIHSVAVKQKTKTYNEPLLDLRRMQFNHSFDVAGFVLTRTEHSNSTTFHADSKQLMSLLFRSGNVLSDISLNSVIGDVDAEDKAENSINIFKDSKVAELQLAFNVVKQLVHRLSTLLKELEDHPVLLQMIQLCEHVLNLPVSSPIMKVLTGLELLMKKSQEWEDYVNNENLSIKKQLHKISVLIIRWRRLELESWPVLMKDRSKDFYKESINAWWIKLYHIINLGQFKELETETQEEKETSQEYEDQMLSGFFTLCFNMMKSCKSGEYAAHLQLLYAFYCQIQVENEIGYDRGTMSKSLRRRISNVLFNIVKYFNQFLPEINERILQERRPIEEKIRDYMKLASWKDVNYHHLKASTEKTHRKVTKILRKYSQILRSPVHELSKDLLSIDNSEVPEGTKFETENKSQENADKKQQKTDEKKNKASEKKKKNKSEPSEPKILNVDRIRLHYNSSTKINTEHFKPLDVESHIKSLFSNSGQVRLWQNEIPSVIERMQSIMQRYVTEGSRIKMTDMAFEFIESLSTSIITRAADLEVRKKAKTMKRRAVADLLHELSFIGISQRTLSQTYLARDDKFPFTQGAVSFRDIYQGKAPLFNNLRGLWRKADDYFFKSIRHLHTLQATNPSSDLGSSEAARMRALAENLFVVITFQRQRFNTIQKGHSHLTQAVDSLEVIIKEHHEKKQLPPQQTILKWLKIQKRYIDNILTIVEELVLSSSSNVSVIGKGLLSTLKSVNNDLIRIKNDIDSVFISHMNKVKNESQETMKKSYETVFFGHKHLSLIQNTFSDLSTDIISVLSAEFNKSPVLKKNPQLQSILQEGSDLIQEFNTEQTSLYLDDNRSNISEQTQEFITQFNSALNVLVKRSMLPFQAHVPPKDHKTDKNNDEIWSTYIHIDEEGEEDAEALLKDADVYFTKAFDKIAIQDIVRALSTLNNLLSQITESQFRNHENNSILSCISRYLSNIKPVLSTLNKLLNIYSFNFIAFHKSICKLEYIILNVFGTLYSKGYCRSNDEEDEDENEESGDLEHSGVGKGMDDGEGAQDVSDQIEDENQVMSGKDADPDNQQEQPEDEDNEGMDVDQDFTGEYEDVDKEKQEEQKEDDDNEVNSDMGDVDSDNEDVVDEKVWDGDDQDELEEKEDTDDRPMDDQGEGEMQAKEDEEEEQDQDNRKEQKQKQKQQQPKEEDIDNDQFDEQNQEGEDEEPNFDEVPEFEDVLGEEGEQPEPREEEDFELPEDLNLDNEEGEEDEGEEDELEEGENTEPQKTDKQDEEESGKNDDEEQEDQTKDMETEDDEDNAASSETVDPKLEEDQQKEDEEKEDEDKDASNIDDAVEDERQDEEENQIENTDEQAAYEEDLQETPYGAEQSSAAKPSATQDENEQDEEREESSKEKKLDSQDTDTKDFNKSQMGESMEEGQRDQQQENQKEEDNAASQFDPNPMRSLGDALKEWKERIQMVEQEEEKAKDNIQDDEQEDKQNEQPEGDAYEYKDEEEPETQDEDQALGPASEEQAQEFPNLEEEQKDEEEDTQEEKMEPDGPEAEDENEDQQEENSQARQDKISNTASSLRFDESAQDMDAEEDEEDRSQDEDDEMEDAEQKDDTVDPQERDEQYTETKAETQQVEQQLAAMPMLDNEDQFTADNLQQMRDQLDTRLHQWRQSSENVQHGKELWHEYDRATGNLAQELSEQLRLILEPTMTTKMKGDYKTGKRINMKKVIPYIASQFKKDKIWLRRTKPNKRNYQVMLAIDDSESMKENNAGPMACEAITLLCKAMSQLEVGELGVVSFGDDVHLLHPFDRPFTDDVGSELLAQFTFEQKDTNFNHFLESSIQMLDVARSLTTATSSNTEQLQLTFIISDGRVLDKEGITKLVRKAHAKKQLLCFILIDNPNHKNSIVDLKTVTYPDGQLTVKPYLDSFPFPYYVILRDINNLPEVLTDALRQWFELIQSMDVDN